MARTDGVRLRHAILKYLRDLQRQSPEPPHLRAIADATGASAEDVNDQIDILDDLGAVNSNRRLDGDATPRITGVGKLLLEELDDELRESSPDAAQATQTDTTPPQWDAVICHAFEDKQSFVQPLADALQKHCRVWYDAFSLTIGDSLRRKIDEGLARSRFGVVILSPSFFSKDWPQRELDGLVAREASGHKVILPVWLDIDRSGVVARSPMLADLYAAKASDGLNEVVKGLLDAMGLAQADDAAVKMHTATDRLAPTRPNLVDDAESNRPRFEVRGGGGATLEASFAPDFKLEQFSGEPMADVQWRIRGPRFQGMDWRHQSGGELKRAHFTHRFDLSEQPIKDDFIEENQMGFEVRFRWGGTWRSEIHRWPLTRRDLEHKVIWDIGKKILPPLLVDDSEE